MSRALEALDQEIERYQRLVAKLKEARDELAQLRPTRAPKRTKPKRRKGGRPTGQGRFRDALAHTILGEASDGVECDKSEDSPCSGNVYRVGCRLCGKSAAERCDAHGGKRAAAIVVTGHCRRAHAEA